MPSSPPTPSRWPWIWTRRSSPRSWRRATSSWPRSITALTTRRSCAPASLRPPVWATRRCCSSPTPSSGVRPSPAWVPPVRSSRPPSRSPRARRCSRSPTTRTRTSTWASSPSGLPTLQPVLPSRGRSPRTCRSPTTVPLPLSSRRTLTRLSMEAAMCCSSFTHRGAATARPWLRFTRSSVSTLRMTTRLPLPRSTPPLTLLTRPLESGASRPSSSSPPDRKPPRTMTVPARRMPLLSSLPPTGSKHSKRTESLSTFEFYPF
mmetsp:Transcript_26020/g.72874  ORF Transcript_26020/g.72874 Transcript_26020/m.72874 type:complete len:262 (-) Transcript_26020:123-908(-)